MIGEPSIKDASLGVICMRKLIEIAAQAHPNILVSGINVSHIDGVNRAYFIIRNQARSSRAFLADVAPEGTAFIKIEYADPRFPRAMVEAALGGFGKPWTDYVK